MRGFFVGKIFPSGPIHEVDESRLHLFQTFTAEYLVLLRGCFKWNYLLDCSNEFEEDDCLTEFSFNKKALPIGRAFLLPNQ